MNRSTFVVSEGEPFFLWWFKLVSSITHQRTVKTGQAPFVANEHDHRILAATDNLSIWAIQLVLSVTHQRIVKIGQPPFLINERSHRSLSSKENPAFRALARQINKFLFLGLSIWDGFSRVSA